MTIGFGMSNPVLNEPRHQWYQKRNHVRIPKSAESKKYLDAFWTSSATPPVSVEGDVKWGADTVTWGGQSPVIWEP